MKISYEREQDILLLEISKKKIDYAKEAGPVIVHFSRKGGLALLEILEVNEFLSVATKISVRALKEKSVPLVI